MKKILNSKGEPITLTAWEKRVADHNQKIVNALGFEVDITTLTTIMKKITEQSFYEIAPGDFIPMAVGGEGAWSSNLLTYVSSLMGGDFEQGIVNTAGNNDKLASADAGIQAVPVPVFNWAKKISWNLMELQIAMKAGNWDLITSREEARKKNWDLGIQKVAFLGIASSGGKILGFLNQPEVAVNSSLIATPISAMTPAQLKDFCESILKVYRQNNEYTAWPTHFTMPEDDYLGLASPASEDFPIRSTMSLLEETFQVMTKNKQFKIQPLAYANAAQAGVAYDTYVLHKYDETSVRMNIPVDYTNTLANSTDNFNYQNVGFGQFTGVKTYKPKEMLYFRRTIS